MGEPRSETPAQKQEAQDAVYAFVGAPERVVLNCDRIVLDDVLDRFGTDIQVFERDEQTFTAVLTTPPRGVRFWALQYLSFVEVAEPAWLRQEIIKSIERNKYFQKDKIPQTLGENRREMAMSIVSIDYLGLPKELGLSTDSYVWWNPFYRWTFSDGENEYSIVCRHAQNTLTRY